MKSKCVNDLGMAAYCMMHLNKVVAKQGKSIYFEVENEDDFDNLVQEYLVSEFHRFDSCLMSLKKMGDFKSKNVNSTNK